MQVMLSFCTKINILIRERFNQLTVVLGDIGTFKPASHDWGRPRTGRTPELEEAILHAVKENPSVSIRQLALTRYG
ncbi:hypothetical protein C0J52_20692 [Blattella germanica]|nr:hypothetical protein C0J52_20692 [Blattella germanica]